MNPKGTADELKAALEFAQRERLVVLSTVSQSGAPEAALMGAAVTDEFELVFDTLSATRKYANLRANARAALVIGCSGAVSLQYEGVAQELAGSMLERYLAVYFAAFPDGRERRQWPGMTYFVVRPTWLRYCDYRQRPPRIVEFTWEN